MTCETQTAYDYEALWRRAAVKNRQLIDRGQRDQRTIEHLSVRLIRAELSSVSRPSVDKIMSALRQYADDEGALHFDGIRKILADHGCV